MTNVDVLVVGGGICGTSLAWQVAAERSVLVLEQEGQLGVHSTGRSVATFVESLDSNLVRALTRGSRTFLEQPPAEFGESVLRPMGFTHIATPDRAAALPALADEVAPFAPDARLLDAAELAALVPYLRPGVWAGGVFEPSAMEIDVARLHAGFARGVGQRGGEVLKGRGLESASYDGSRWRVVDTAGEEHRAEVLVDAAGAWGDDVARRCGVRTVGLQPYRRTVFGLSTGDFSTAGVPMVVDLAERFYLKPETGQVLCSPIDETPDEAQDVKPEMEDIARTMEVVDELTLLAPRRVLSSWAGLRTFVVDHKPVVGWDGGAPGFFWYVGQGGYGVQTSPALSAFGAVELLDRALPEGLEAGGLERGVFGPGRLSAG